MAAKPQQPDPTGAGHDAADVGRATSIRPHSGEWVRARLLALDEAGDWRDNGELLDWLRLVAERRARDVPRHDRRDVVQDALIDILRIVQESLPRFVAASNPAALLERVVARRVGHARHRASMTGLSGVSANGRNWRKRYPRHLGGIAAIRVMSEIATAPSAPCVEVARTASRLAEYVHEEVGVVLSDDAIDALTYVLDRLAGGVSRSTLVRGHTGLRTDPAMAHLGFCPTSAGGFGCWLLGRTDGRHDAPSVLDAFLDGRSAAPNVAAGWRRQAIAFGFVAEPEEPSRGAATDGPQRRTA